MPSDLLLGAVLEVEEERLNEQHYLPVCAHEKADVDESVRLTPKADMCSALAHVCFGPRVDKRLLPANRLTVAQEYCAVERPKSSSDR